MSDVHSQVPHIRPNPPFLASSLAGCAQNLRPLCSRIWQHGLDGCELQPCGLPAGMLTVSTAETGSFPRKLQDRQMPADRDMPQVRWSIPVSKLCLLLQRPIN